MSKQRFIIHCTTDWCGMDNDFPALANDESELWDYADELAINNLMSYVSIDELAENLGYSEDYDDFEEILDRIEPSDYVRSSIELFDGTDEEWNELINYHGEVYEENSEEKRN